MRGYATLIPEALAWYAEHHDGRRTAVRPSPVRIEVTGSDDRREFESWPPLADERSLYLHPDGSLADEPAQLDASAVTFTYGPSDPTPTVGGPLFGERVNGVRNDDELAHRTDVLTFTGPALSEPIEIIGIAVVELRHHSDNPHADIFVRISDVDRKGRSHNVTEGFTRLNTAGQIGEALRLEFDAAAHRFLVGHRIRLTISGGSFPRFERNLGTGEDPANSTSLAVSHRSIDTSRSRVLLPVFG